jgi:hypothetical protein
MYVKVHVYTKNLWYSFHADPYYIGNDINWYISKNILYNISIELLYYTNKTYMLIV